MAAAAATQPLVEMEGIPGRGRALIATRDIKPGEVLLSDSPLLLYPAAPTADSPSSFCSFCFRTLSSPPLRCPTCPLAFFCGARCLSLARDSTHCPWACQALALFRSLPPPLDPDLLSQAHFLIAAYSLPPSSAHLLSLLESGGGRNEEKPHPALLSLLSHLPPNAGFSPDRTASLLSVDKRNAFGLMEPFRDGDAAGSGRLVRAYGIYPTASFFNHDCLPNACRFDDVERGTEIAVRAIHDIPKGREVCLSYFPVNWSYAERQERLMVDYGFRCECDRCEVEKNWKEEEEEADVMEMGGDDEEEEGMEEGGDGDGDFPHAYFFVRYLCDRENCGGTLAPLPPSPQHDMSDVMECNVCGRLRSEEDFDRDGGGDDGDGDMLDE